MIEREFDPQAVDCLDPEALPSGEPESLTERVVHASPWWAVSGILHLILVIVSMYIIALLPTDREIEIVHLKPPELKAPPPPPPPEKKLRDQKLDLDKPVEVELIRKVFPSETNETPNDDPWEKSKGESEDALTEHPFKSRSVNSSIGVGGGRAGKYGTPFGGNNLGGTNGGDRGTADLVMNALDWLARHQGQDGSWRATGYTNECGRTRRGVCSPTAGAEDFNHGLTGLSLLAFLGAGYTHLSRDVIDGIHYGKVVKRGIQYLMRIQQPDGRIGGDERKYMYNHTIAAYALCEAYGLTGSMMIKGAAQKSIDYIVQAQNPGKAWRYSYRAGDNDSSVSGWAVQALKSAEVSGLSVPDTAYDGALAWYDEVTDDAYSWVGYVDKRRGKIVIPGKNEEYAGHEALAAIGMMVRVFATGSRADPHIRGGSELLIQDPPSWDDRALNVDMYYWYYASYAMFLADGPNGSRWNKWIDALKPSLIDTQHRVEDCRRGSWEPVDRWSAEGGRVYVTAMGALTMEVYYRLGPVLRLLESKR